MPLHVGDGRFLRAASVVAVLDYELFRKTPVNRHFLEAVRVAGRLDAAPSGGDRTQSVVLTDREAVLSDLSPKTLASRAGAHPVGRTSRAVRRRRLLRTQRRAVRRRKPS